MDCFFLLDQNRKTDTEKTGPTITLKLMIIVFHLSAFSISRATDKKVHISVKNNIHLHVELSY